MGAHCLRDSPGKNTGVGCHFLLQCIKVKSESEVAQSCPTLSDPMDCSLPASSIHGIFQARVLEWGTIAFSEIVYLDYIKSVLLRISLNLKLFNEGNIKWNKHNLFSTLCRTKYKLKWYQLSLIIFFFIFNSPTQYSFCSEKTAFQYLFFFFHCGMIQLYTWKPVFHFIQHKL